MIKATDIIYLITEHWMTDYRKNKFEVLENPRSWRAAASALKDDLRSSRYMEYYDEILRFSYYPKQQELKVWVAYHAVHCRVELPPRGDDCWQGWIDISHQEANCMYPNNSEQYDENIDSLESLPRPLQKFLSGLELNPDLEI